MIEHFDDVILCLAFRHLDHESVNLFALRPCEPTSHRIFAAVVSRGDGLRRTDTAVREWAGLLVYRLTGNSTELLPGPGQR